MKTFSLKKYHSFIWLALVVFPIDNALASPVAKDDILFSAVNTVLSGNVSTNDTDTSGNLNSPIYELVTPPLNGSLTAVDPISTSGAFTYTPNTGFTGVDIFSYQITDAEDNVSDVATVFLAVGPMQFISAANPAVAISMPNTTNRTVAVLNTRANNAQQNFTVAKNAQGSFNIITGLSASKALETWSPNAAGTVVSVYTLNNLAWQQFAFESHNDSSLLIKSLYTNYYYKAGSATIGTQVAAGTTAGGLADRWILAAPGLSPSPLTSSDSYTITNDAILTGNVLLNDSATGPEIAAYIGSPPAHGQLVGDGALYGGVAHWGSFAYQPDPDFVGIDRFTYYAKSSSTGSPSRITTVTINVTEPAPDFIVSNSSQLQAALTQATGGEIIQLQNGNYGDLTISRLYSDYVVIRAANPLGAVFGKISIGSNRGYVHFDRIYAQEINATATATSPARYLKYTNSKFTNTVYFRYATNVVVDKNIIDVTSLHALLMNSVSNLQVTRNFIARAQEDLMRLTGDSNTGLIENNIFYDANPRNIPAPGDPCRYNHSDGLQMFGADGKNPRNITVRGNLFYDNPLNNDLRPPSCVQGRTDVRLNMQGIFLSDPQGNAYENFLVEENLAQIGSPNTIYINGATLSVVIRNNTLLTWSGGKGGSIKVVEDDYSNSGVNVYGNVASAVTDPSTLTESGIQIGDNFEYRDHDPTYTPGNLFQGGGQGSQWQHYLPVENTPIDFGSTYGAQIRLMQLLTGDLDVLLPPQLQ